MNNNYTNFPHYAGYSGLGRGIPFDFNGVRYGQPTNHACYDYTTASAIANGMMGISMLSNLNHSNAGSTNFTSVLSPPILNLSSDLCNISSTSHTSHNEKHSNNISHDKKFEKFQKA